MSCNCIHTLNERVFAARRVSFIGVGLQHILYGMSALDMWSETVASLLTSSTDKRVDKGR